jgi:hypothetical protein
MNAIIALNPQQMATDPGGWRPLESAPSGMPVLVQYREWNNPRNRLIEQVAWKWGGEWRVYPQTDGRAYAERWGPIPNTPQAEPAPAPADEPPPPPLPEPAWMTQLCGHDPHYFYTADQMRAYRSQK